ncbi:hypothetical protein MR810_05400 [bacterium]|nr:hypothetical protein [bacterium]
MLNYNWIRVLRAICFAGLAAILILAFTQPAGASALRCALPGIIAIGCIILQVVLRAIAFPCPRCGKHKTTTAFALSRLKKDSVLHCPDCGEELRFRQKNEVK